METEYIYAVNGRVWADDRGCWLFSEPLYDEKQAVEIYDISLDESRSVRLIILPESILPVNDQVNLRLLLSGCEETGYVLLSRAAEVLTWDKDHNFCPRCGNQLSHHQQDLAKQCDHCGLVQYPRLSPCIITLVTRGEYCLLAHGVRFPQPRYSTLAGFIEAGESAEDALVREVREEVGIDVCNIRYFRSQSWPFPHSFMLGYFADYAGGEITPDPAEIVDAQWFHYTELDSAPIPPAFTIARKLIDQFISECQR